MDSFKNVYVPYRGYYSTPFCRWQGSMQNENSIELGAQTARRWFLERKKFDPTVIDYLYFGITVAQHYLFFGHTWSGAILTDDKKHVPGLLIHQACSTSTTALQLAALAVDHNSVEVAFGLMADRCSNSAHTVWPQTLNPGGHVESENWMMDGFEGDPRVHTRMLKTAENVAREIGLTKEECDSVVLRRYEQYQMALANEREFQKRYMFPAQVKVGRKETKLIDADEGVTPTTAGGLARLKAVEPGGVHSFGAQTFPADGNCGFIVTTRGKAKELSDDPAIEIKVVSYGFARVKPAFMPAAPVPAAEMALANAGLKIEEMKAIKSHNPFAATDLNFARKMGVDVMKMNNYGCSLIYGHPQAPTAGRTIIEMWEEMVALGGGYCLFTGCAAGDTAAAMIFKVG